jgi:hypothetical protein
LLPWVCILAFTRSDGAKDPGGGSDDDDDDYNTDDADDDDDDDDDVDDDDDNDNDDDDDDDADGDDERDREGGYVGLCNLGNTCYMNAVLTALFMLYKFRRAVLAFPRPKFRSGCSPQINLALVLEGVFYHMQSARREAFSPGKFLLAAAACGWQIEGNPQCDPNEFYHNLLGHLSATTLKASIDGLFMFGMTSLVTNAEHNISRPTSNQWGSMTAVVADKTLDVEVWIAEDGKEGSPTCIASRVFLPDSLPAVLTVEIKRTPQSGHRKLMGNFAFPQHLTMTCKGKAVQYHLHSVVVHSGTRSASGHCWSIVYAFPSRGGSVGGQWYRFEDS